MGVAITACCVAFYAFGFWAGRDAARWDAWDLLARRAWPEQPAARSALWSASARVFAPWWSIDWGGRWTS